MRATAALLCAMFATQGWAGTELTIALKPQARVSTGLVVLGEVATLQTSDLALLRTLVDLPIGQAPPPGQSVKIARDSLGPWIQHHLRRADLRLRWQGDPSTEVITRSDGVSGDEIAATAMRALTEWLTSNGGRHEVDPVAPPRDVTVPAGPVRLQARSLAATQIRERMVVWVDVHVAERFVRAVPVSFRVASWQPQLVATAPVAARAPLGDHSVTWREVDVASQTGAKVPFLAELNGQRSRRSLQAGEVIKARDLEAAPDVARGQWAVLRTASGPVALEARVEVLQDGRRGDRVRVRPPSGNVTHGGLLARVVGEGQLEVIR